jgi:hypothetical protein
MSDTWNAGPEWPQAGRTAVSESSSPDDRLDRLAEEFLVRDSSPKTTGCGACRHALPPA